MSTDHAGNIEYRFSVAFLFHPEDDEPRQLAYPLEMRDMFRLGTQVDLDACPILQAHCKEWDYESDKLEWLTVERVQMSSYMHEGVVVCSTVAYLTRDNHCQNCGWELGT